jgi:peptidoglycan/LPS O-acetylase OafA/YrhL
MSFSKGFLRGSLLGSGIIALSLLAWGIMVLVGLENDTSTDGIFVLSLYVLSFGLGGGALAMLKGDAPTLLQSIVGWSAAISIVVLASAVTAFLSESDRPIERYWGFVSSALLLALLVASGLRVRMKDHKHVAE